MNHDLRQLEEIARDEAWLARFPTPAPSRECADATRAAMRTALSADQRRIALHWQSWHGAVAAAAAIAVFVALGSYAVRHEPAPKATTELADDWVPEGIEEQGQIALAELDSDELYMDYSLEFGDEAGGRDLYDALEEALRGTTNGNAGRRMQ